MEAVAALTHLAHLDLGSLSHSFCELWQRLGQMCPFLSNCLFCLVCHSWAPVEPQQNILKTFFKKYCWGFWTSVI